MFQGSLEEVKLPDVIQLMSVSAKTGYFVLTREQEEGHIYLEEGQLVHAQCGDLTGEEAIYSLAIWDRGQFQFRQGEKGTVEKTITRPNTKILMAVARKLDEWRVLSKRIPSLDLIPELDSLGHKKVSFNTQEWHVLSKINGVNSITRIAALTSQAAIDVAKLVYGLVASGLVHLREKPKPSPDANPLEQQHQKSAGARSPEDEKEWLSGKIEKIYQSSKQVLGAIAHSMIQRHCANGVKGINQGKGISAVIETATQIVKAAQILEGPEKTKELTVGLKKIIKES